MVAYDDSAQSHKALSVCLKILKPEVDELVLVTVAQLYEKNVKNTLQVDFDYQILDSANESILKESRETLDRVTKECKLANVKTTSIVEPGNPRELLCQFSEKYNIDILVMGSRGLGTIKSILLGSVSDYVTKFAKCAVTVVH